jgi:hypothetical protein
LKQLPNWILRNPALPWGALFLALAIGVTQYGATNALSRIAALRAITEGHTLSIDNYKDWTVDWARAPNGKLYSNKAPGAVFIALPIFALCDQLAFATQAKYIDGQGRIPAPGYFEHLILVFSTQLLPFFFLVLWISHRLLAGGASLPAVHFFALAAFFGNTAAIYMNCFLGHGVAAWLFLGAYFTWHERRYLYAGLFLSWALLSDYGVTFALPFFFLATLLREKNWRSLFQIALGAMPGALVWIWFHYTAFGSPFVTANQFTNPEQIEALPGRFSLWGEFSPLPSASVVWELVAGTKRGILFTQPWMFGVAALPFLRRSPLPAGSGCLALGSLAGLIWMNGGFGGWHGGWCLGPRYLSVVFPAVALAIAMHWRAIPGGLKVFLWGGLFFSLAFRLLVFPFSNLAPLDNLWAFYLDLCLGEHRGTTALRFAMAALFISAALYWQARRGAWKFVPISGDSV